MNAGEPKQGGREPGEARTRRAVALVLGLGIGVLLLYLALAPKPWSAGVTAALARGSDLDPVDYVITWLWWASLLNAGLLALALATLPLWLAPGPAPTVAALGPPARRPSRVAVAAVAAAMLVAGALAAPRLSQSLWVDEIWSLMRAIDGYWRRGDDGELHFRAPTWFDTVWYYRGPNNHVPYSILSRLSLRAWQHARAEGGLRVGEAALRLPAFAFGLASIASAAWFLWRAGFPGAGVVLAWLLALHPWHMRYASEARGYSLMLALYTLQLSLWLATLHRGTWVRWLAYAGVQFLLLWTHPGMGVAVVIGNLGMLAALLHFHRGRVRRGQVLRWVAANAACAVLLIQLFAPLVPQTLHYMGKQRKLENPVDGDWLRKTAAHLYLGMDWKVTTHAEWPYPQLFDAERGRVPAPILAGGLAALAAVLAGAARLARRGRPHAVLTAVLLLPGPLLVLAARAIGLFLWEWYLLFVLPAWGGLVALALAWPMDAGGTWRRRSAALGIVAVLVAFVVASQPIRETLRSRSIQPRRESVALTRPTLDPTAPSQRSVLTASFSIVPAYYDPNGYEPETAADLRALMERSDREGIPFYVNIGGLSRAKRRAPELAGIVLDPRLFEPVAVLYGLKQRHSRYVYRYRGAGAASPAEEGAPDEFGAAPRLGKPSSDMRAAMSCPAEATRTSLSMKRMVPSRSM